MTEALAGIRLELGPDKLTAVVVIEPGTRTSELNEMLIEGFLLERGLPIDPSRFAKLRELVERCVKSPGERHTMTVAEGRAPRHGEDGRFELLVGNAPGVKHTESGGTDHYASRLTRTVKEGGTIGRFVPPTDPLDGVDVFGRAIAAKPAKIAHVKFDDSVDRTGDDRLVAKHGGMVEFDGLNLRVNPKLEIRGNVDFSTGGIEFPGDVIVFGDVRDRFTVSSGRDLTVHKLVDGATIRAARDCTLMHGMATKEDHSLLVGRDLNAKYLTGVTVNVIGNAKVESDISHCVMKVTGSLHAAGCCVVRGELHVKGACEVAEIGCEAGAKTSVRIGNDGKSAAVLDDAGHLLHSLDARYQKTQERLRELRSIQGKMTSTQADALTELSYEAEQLGTMQERVRKSATKLTTANTSAEAPSLVVHRVVHPHSEIMFGLYRIEFSEAVKGPLRIEADAGGRPVFRDKATREDRPTPSGVRIVTIPADEASKHAA